MASLVTRQFSVVANPDSRTRGNAPFLVVLQSHYLRVLDTVMVAPLMRADVIQADDALWLSIPFEGEIYTLDLALMTHIDRRLLGQPVGELTEHDAVIRWGVERIFNGF